MNYLLAYICVLVGVILLLPYRYTRVQEDFTQGRRGNNQTKTCVLLGDSILKNNAYVSAEKSVEYIVAERIPNTHCFAEDHSTIADTFGQLDRVSSAMDTANTWLFLSAGGNDILSHFVEQNQDIANTRVLSPMFASYKNLVKSIRIRAPNAHLVLLDIYYPDNMKYQAFHPILRQWNDLIYSFAQTQSLSVIRISQRLTHPEDFSFGIEPSNVGGEKIADLICGELVT